MHAFIAESNNWYKGGYLSVRGVIGGAAVGIISGRYRKLKATMVSF